MLMARRRAAVLQPRWTTRCSEEISRPKKPELLEAAVEQLGPFEFKTSKEALEQGACRDIHEEQVGVSEELARALVENLARRFNTDEHLEKNAPRFKHVIERLDELSLLARALATHLDSLDDITRHELQICGTRSHLQHTLADLRTAADVAALPRPAADNSPQEHQWTQR